MPFPACPDAQSLEQFVLGLLDEGVAGDLERHISDCASCVNTLRDLSTRDDLVDILRGAAPVAVADPEISAVLFRMRKRPAGSRDGQTPPVVPAGDSTEALGTIREYRLLAKLGEGGMGTVYRAQHTKLKRQVAIKVLPPDRVQSPQAITRFEREMQAVGALDHPHIVRAFDAGVHDGRHYLVMEFVKGRDVSQLVPGGKTLAIADACEIVRQAAIGLAHAHEAGLVHRDIKPSNLLVTDTGVVKILDLGLARIGQENEGAVELTSTGAIMGTIDYMAPEQATSTHDVDIRADIYSLGATLYRLLTGTSPLFGEQFDTPVKKLMALGTKSPTPIRTVRPEVTGALASLVNDLLAKDPDDRPPTPADVAEALEPFCSGANLPRLMASLPPSVVEPAARPVEPQSQRKTEASYSNPSADTAPTIDRAAPLALPFRIDGGQPTTPFIPRAGANEAVGAKRPPQPLVAAWGGRHARQTVAIVAACCCAALVLLLGVVFYLQTPDGTVRIEILDPDIRVTIEGGGKTTFSGARKNHKIVLEPGPHGITITRGDLTFGTTSFELKKGDKPRLRIEYIAGKVHVTKDGAALPVTPKTHAFNGASELPAAPQTTVAPAGSIAAEGFALEFNGKDSYVDVPALHYDGSHPITIEATIVPYQAVAQGVVVGDREKEAGQSGVALKFPIDDGLSPKVGAFVVGNGSRFHGAKSRDGIIPKRRIQVAGVREGSMIRLFMDGKLQSTSEIEGYRPRSGPFNIGASNPGEGSAAMSFSGIIDEVRISRVARYDADYTPLPRLETDEHTMALYHFDEGAGDVLKDSSANNHNGQIVRAKWVRADGSPIQLAAGWHGWPTDAPPPAIAPFDAAQAIKHQEAWAKYLGLPVEWENSLGMKFRLIPPGEFTMGATQAEIDEGLGIVKGDPKYDLDQIRSSGPPHRVILSQPIYLAAHEVTQAQYEAVIGKNPSAYAVSGRFPEKVALVKGLDTSGHPVDGVSWNDAAEFSAELSEREKLGPCYFRAGDAVTVLEGNGYRLPSEATWEFACRGGTTSRYWSGDRNDDLVRVGWFGMNSGARTHTVGELPANPFGLFDMHGNVMEWCQDWWDPDNYPRSGSEAAHDPAGPMTGTERTKRGGGWGNYNCICRSATRGRGRPSDGAAIIGFRVALPVEAVQQRIAADGFALEFNGKDSYVELPTLKYDGSHPVTIEAWATPASLRETGYSFIVDNVDEGHGGDQYWPAGLGLQQRALGDGTNCWGAWLSTDKPPAAHNQIVGSPAHWSIGRTAHLTLQFANDQVQLYVDGKLVNERRFPDRHRASKRRFVIGNRFAGRVHAVRISGIVRYPLSFVPRTHLERDKHTLALYDFTEGQGDLLTDLSGNEHHGKIVGATWVKAVANSSAQAPSGPAATNK